MKNISKRKKKINYDIIPLKWTRLSPIKPERQFVKYKLDSVFTESSDAVLFINKQLIDNIAEKMNLGIQVQIESHHNIDEYEEKTDLEVVYLSPEHEDDYQKRIEQWKKDIKKYNEDYENWKILLQEKKKYLKNIQEKEERELYESLKEKFEMYEKLKQRFESKNDQ